MPGEETSLLTRPPCGALGSTSTYPTFGLFSDFLTSWPYRHFDIRDVCKRGDYKSLKDFVNTHRDERWLKEMVNRLYPSGPPYII